MTSGNFDQYLNEPDLCNLVQAFPFIGKEGNDTQHGKPFAKANKKPLKEFLPPSPIVIDIFPLRFGNIFFGEVAVLA